MNILKNHRVAAIIFFSAYFVLGSRVSGDFGAHTDEFIHQVFGKRWGMYVEKAFSQGRIPETCDFVRDIPFYSDAFQGNHNLSHGPFWEVTLYEAQKIFLGTGADSRAIILFRHRAIFLLFFISVIFFYRLCRRMFKNPWLGLIGCSLLVLHPRIFADSFYNTADISFLSLYTISAYTLIRFLDKKNIQSALWHALACALLVDIRIVGLIMPLVTAFLIASELFFNRSKGKRGADIKLFGIYGFVFALTMILFWPFLWRDTLSNFIASIKGGMGDLLVSGELPKEMSPGPFYNPVWIAATTPVIYLVFFAIGILGSVKSAIRDKGFHAALLLFFLPIVATAANPHLFIYDGWRHHYFVYSAFVLICVFGIRNAVTLTNRLGSAKFRKGARLLFVSLSAAGMFATVSFMLRNHPYQFVYTNALSDGLSGRTGYFFPFDYWGVSHRQALESILSRDQRRIIRVYFPQWRWESANIALMPEKERARLRLTMDSGEADYVIVKYDGGKTSLPIKPFYTVSVESRPIAVVYQVRSR